MISSYNFVNLKVGSLNCRSLNDRVKRLSIFDQIANSDLTVVCLQETKLSPEKEKYYCDEWDRGPSFFNSVKGGKCGTAILFNTRQVVIKNTLMDQSGRIICVDVDINGTLLHTYSEYLFSKYLF